MPYRYPLTLTPDDAGRVVATSPILHELATDGADRAEAIEEAEDAALAVLAGYMMEGRDVPESTGNEACDAWLTLSPLVAAKLALYQALRSAGISKSAFARHLGVDEAEVRRLLDLDHRSHIDRVAAALRTMGRRLEVRTELIDA